MNNIQSECISCHKKYTQKTLEKYRGLYCKPCFFNVLIKENNDYKKILSENDGYKKNLSKKNKIFINILRENNISLLESVSGYSGITNAISSTATMSKSGNWVCSASPDYFNLKKHEGPVKIYKEDGMIFYNGEWKNGKTNGKGKSYYKHGRLQYDGGWKDGKYDGNGELYYDNGSLSLYYDGEWKEGSRDGSGKSYRGDGSLYYDGEWKDGRPHGKGKYTWLNGEKYDGEWKEGKKHGYGIEYQNESIIKKGIWVDGIYSHERIEEEDQCIICFTYKKCYAFIPCGHLCMCEKCHEKYQDDKCIICRKEYSISYKIFD